MTTPVDDADRAPLTPGLRLPISSLPAPTRIVPPGGWPGWGLEELWRHRSVAIVLARRTLMVRYRTTALGALWVLLQPLILMLVFTVFFGALARVDTDGVPFAVFFLSGLVFMTNATKILTEGGMSIVGNGALIARLYVPRAYFPLSVALASLVDLAFSLLALLVVMLWDGVVPTWTVAVLPIIVAISFTTALGLAFWFAALHAEYRDLQVMLPFLTQLWFFLSPIIYSASIVPEQYLPLYYLNPMGLVITGGRWAFLGSPAPPIWAWPEAIVVSCLILVSGYLFFRARERTFADVI